MIKSLHIVSSLEDNGGVQQLLYTYASRLYDEIRFDFIVHEYSESLLVQKFKKLGSVIYDQLLPRKEVGVKKYLQLLKDVIKKLPHYDIIHIHLNYKSFIPLYYCKKFFKKTPVVVHMHSTLLINSLKEKIIRELAIMYIKRKADDFFACGEKAGKTFYGEKFFYKKNVFIMPNAIEIERFAFNKNKRNEIRKQLNIEGKKVYGHVGTFYSPKNHEFLIDIFNEMQKKDDSAVLVLVGSGELFDKIKNKVKELKLDNKVFFTGIKRNVSDYLSAFDFFILPSIYEGVPVSIVEAESAGLKCFVSDSVTREIDVCSDIDYISLKEEPSVWASKIEDNSIPQEKIRIEKNVLMKKSIYNIEQSSNLLLERYSRFFKND